jgi:hypothetical protein
MAHSGDTQARLNAIACGATGLGARAGGQPEILDGKQRIQTLKDFTQSRFPYRPENDDPVYWHQLNRRDRSFFERRTIQFSELDGENLSRTDLLEIFLDVNAGGVPQSEEHLTKVRQMLKEEKAK